MQSKNIFIPLSILVASSSSLAQNFDSFFRNNQSAQNLNLITTTDRFEAYLDQNKILVNPDNSITAEALLEFKNPLEDGTKSRSLIYTYYCNDKVEKKLTYVEFSDFSGANKTGAFIKGEKIKASINLIKSNTLGENLFDSVCNSIKSQSTNASSPNSQEGSIASTSGATNKFSHTSKLNSSQIRSLLIQSSWTKEEIEKFNYNYSFIYAIHSRMQPKPNDPYDYLNREHRAALTPFNNIISSNLKGMNAIIGKIARSLETKPEIIWDSFGISLNNEGTGLASRMGDNISKGRLDAGEFWLRRPSNYRGVNLPYNAMGPDVLFNQFFPKFINEYDQNISKIISKATDYENQQLELSKKREERNQWLKTADGQKFLAEEDAKRKKAAEDRIAHAAAERARIAKEFPFYAEITCNNGGYGNFQIHSCFSGSPNVIFELTNGKEYKFFSLPDIMDLAAKEMSDSAVIIDLRSNYKIRMQNAGDTWILGLRIFRRNDNTVLFQRKVTGFGVISANN